ncbi:MAG TPA: isochorismatase, partial [Leptospiraceae bacterium]|nr:isochorismatase [Leptospiraceae bacterium]
MTAPSILITQCLQNDFVRLIDRYEALPNLLHVGYDESMRLLGERMEEGPVRSMLHWAYERSPEELAIIHIRDWHNPSDPAQKDHLKQFGPHCVQDTEGARFVFEESLDPARHTIVNASGLNDFVDTTLEEVLRPYRGKPVRVGIAGVW